MRDGRPAAHPAADARAAPDGVVCAVSARADHAPGKTAQRSVRLLRGLGVAGDAHMGERVQHRSRVARDPTQPNLRPVHLIHAELLDALAAAGLAVRPGEMGRTSRRAAWISSRCPPGRGYASARTE
jgi:hypothetical protein